MCAVGSHLAFLLLPASPPPSPRLPLPAPTPCPPAEATGRSEPRHHGLRDADARAGRARAPTCPPRHLSERDNWSQHSWGQCKVHFFLPEGLLGTPVYRAHLFLESDKIHYFAAARLVLIPVVRDQETKSMLESKPHRGPVPLCLRRERACRRIRSARFRSQGGASLGRSWRYSTLGTSYSSTYQRRRD